MSEEANVADLLVDDDLTLDEHLLEVLDRLGGEVEKEELVTDLPYSPHLVREVITDLEGRGLVERRPVPRSWVIALAEYDG